MTHDTSSRSRLRPTRAIHRVPAPRVAVPRHDAPDAADVARHWVIGPSADLEGFLCQVAAICEATGPGGGPPDILWLRELARVYGLVPAEARVPEAR